MFINDGPISAANKLQDYLIFNMANIPEVAREKLTEVARERSPADILVKGSELLFSALLQCPDMPNPEAAWEAVGLSALQVAHSNLWARGERGYALMTYANFKVNGTVGDMPAPEVPALADEYRIVQPAVEAPPVPPEGALIPPGPAPAEPTPPPTPEPEPG